MVRLIAIVSATLEKMITMKLLLPRFSRLSVVYCNSVVLLFSS